jgi:hypothetical protein
VLISNMVDDSGREYLQLESDAENALVEGARSAAAVSGLTHCFYKYPARFSPAFARVAIETFTKPGDLVLDNHVGGGTSLVEAIATGRRAVGVDISSLAEFVSSVKTTLYSDRELDSLTRWARRVPSKVNIKRSSARHEDYERLGYYKHLDHPDRWRIRKAIEQILTSATGLNSARLEAFGRCTALRVAQWALDARKELPKISELRSNLVVTALEMVEGARSLRIAVNSSTDRHCPPRATVLNRTAIGIENEPRLASMGPPALVLTSPPYPGVHVLYHRWQVDGGKEMPAPFWIAGKLDGAGSSYYTMGDRKYPELRTYFENITNSMSSVAVLSSARTVIVQMVAFSAPDWQLPKYIEAMNRAGLQEVFLFSLANNRDGRLWRKVPRRKWYSQKRGETPGTQELVLFFKKSRPVIDTSIYAVEHPHTF